MTILILGGGGREHALADALAKSPTAGRLVVAPGNPGVEPIAMRRPLDICDPAAVVAAARAVEAELVVVGPEAPLAAGVSDALRKAGFAVFGPSRAAAMLETSKSFAKEVLHAAGAPTADFEVFEDADLAEAYIRAGADRLVVKADGLAAGKGVVVAATQDEAAAAARDALAGRFGAAGARVVIEALLNGDELSVFALTDGETARIIGAAQDHKRAYDGDQGPNTGGMGAYAPAPIATPRLMRRVEAEIVAPVLAEMRRRGAPYQGVLFIGLMVDAKGAPSVIEFNARFGDPEAQVILPRLEADLAALMRLAAAGPEAGLADAPIAVSAEAALGVVIAAKGYPGEHARGQRIGGLAAAAQTATVYHAGTERDDDGEIVSAGGRVLTVVGRGASLSEAREAAYAATDAVDWPGGFYRRDIGWRAFAREDDDGDDGEEGGDA